MKRSLFGAMLLALTIAVSAPAMAQVSVSVSVGLAPPIVFAAPPRLIVLPDRYVYVVPDIDVELFFWNGWWWRLGKAAGIAHGIITGVGIIIAGFPFSTLM